MTDENAEGRSPGDATGDTRWMSYTELAEALGIKRSSAKRVAMRHRWQRQQGNDATARVAVPVTVLNGRRSITDDSQALSPVHPVQSPGDDHPAVTAFAAALALAREQVLAADARAERAEAKTEQADADRRAAEARADRAEAALGAERTRADGLRDRLDTLTGELREVKEAAEGLRQAEMARQAQGLLARLRGAWRRG